MEEARGQLFWEGSVKEENHLEKEWDEVCLDEGSEKRRIGGVLSSNFSGWETALGERC